ncbi:DUF2894 domain-containing protein [Lysobacter enzymogenes]|nr:DUF2894 domain-containing protein [Lysobacter enzymogenes]
MNSVPASADAADPRTTLEAWRARGYDRCDRAGFARIDALERRAAGRRAAAVLDARVRELIGIYAGALERRQAQASETAARGAGAQASAVDAATAAAAPPSALRARARSANPGRARKPRRRRRP